MGNYKYDNGTKNRILGLYTAAKMFHNCKLLIIENNKIKIRGFIDSLYKVFNQIKRAYEIHRLVSTNVKAKNFNIVQTRIFNVPYLLLLKIKLNVKIVLDIHALSSLETDNPIERSFWRTYEFIFIWASNVVLVPTKQLKEYIQKKYMYKKIYVIRNPINFINIKDNKKCNDSYIAIYHGTPYKENYFGLIRYVKIIERLNSKGFKIKGLIAGRFKKIIKSKNVIYLGYVENLSNIFKKVDIAILPVKPKSLGIRSRILEYMQNGLITITTKEGAMGLEEAAKEGLIIVASNINDFVLQIEKILTTTSKNNSKFEEVIKKHYQSNIIGSKLKLIYKSL